MNNMEVFTIKKEKVEKKDTVVIAPWVDDYQGLVLNSLINTPTDKLIYQAKKKVFETK